MVRHSNKLLRDVIDVPGNKSVGSRSRQVIIAVYSTLAKLHFIPVLHFPVQKRRWHTEITKPGREPQHLELKEGL